MGKIFRTGKTVSFRLPTIAVAATVIFALLACSPTTAHEIRPSIADFQIDQSDRFVINIRLNAEALIAGIGPEHEDTDDSPQAEAYNALRELPPEQLADRFESYRSDFLEEVGLHFDGERITPDTVSINVAPVGDTSLARDSIVTLSGPIPEDAETFRWKWGESLGPSVIRINTADGGNLGAEEGYSAYLSAGEASEAIEFRGAQARGFTETVWEYVVIGFTHIVPKGLDHILFVVGLFLLSTKFSSLLWQVTAFTLAHTITLALGVLGLVQISPAIVEPLIALSIVYVAVENILTDHLQKWRPVIVFFFGLLHGLGFAGVLQDIGLSTSYFITALIAFNVGVELGQLVVIAICMLGVGIWFGNKSWYRQAITIPASLLIALIASWWFYERVFLT